MLAWTKISDEGSSHPTNARIAIGLGEILQLTKLPKDNKETIEALLYELSLELISAQKVGQIVVAEIEDVYKRHIVAFGKADGSPYESALSLDKALIFLKHGKTCLRKIASILTIAFDLKSDKKDEIKRCKDGRFDLILKHLKQKFPEDHSLLKLLTMYERWYKLFNELRNNDEHPAMPLNNYYNFKFNDKGEFEKPHFIHSESNVPVDEFLSASLQYLFQFAETAILIAMHECLPEFLTIVEIPEQERRPQCPKKFKVVPLGHATMSDSNYNAEL